MTTTRSASIAAHALLLMVTVLLAPQLSAADRRAGKDIIYQVSGPPIYCHVFHDGLEEIEYKVDKRLPNMQTIQRRRVARIVYAGMSEGFWEAGMNDMASGQYEIAAQRFMTLASGQNQWEQTYGAFQAGVCLELAGAHEQAATTFGNLASAHPTHILLLDALYRQGVNLAMSGDGAAAENVAAALDNIYRENRALRNAEPRAAAIRAAILALVENDLREAISQARRVTIREEQSAAHWGNFWASVLRDNEQWEDAADFYEDLLEDVRDPGQRARLRLGMGVSLANAGEIESALAELMAIDALPYGSPAERVEAQYWAGRLLWETAATTLATSDREKRIEFAEEKQAMARELLEAVAGNNAVDSPYPALAEAYIADNLPSEEEEAKGDEAAADDEAAE